MSVKRALINILELNRGEYISGEELANSLKVSRAAVWKAINQLKKDGYTITAVTNKGYCLLTSNDVISAEGIKSNLKTPYQNIPVQVDKIVNSTNICAKLAATNGADHGSVFVSEKQTMGRGRMGRTFLSMDGNSIYMSLVLRPKVSASDAIYITTAASVAVMRAIRKVTGKSVLIKWVNDLFFEGKKVCGILTEAVTNIETGIIDSVVLGIGINFNVQNTNIPIELKEIATALYSGDTYGVTRNQLIGEIINQVLDICESIEDKSFLKEYKEYSMILGSNIYIISGEEKTEAKAIDINEYGGLVVELKDGTIKNLNSGEVSIRKQ